MIPSILQQPSHPNKVTSDAVAVLEVAVASTQEERRDEARLMLLRYVSENPEASTREIANAIGVSNGAAYYLLKALIEKGLVKAQNFANAKSKSAYLYVLTPEGIKQRLGLTERFLVRKRNEYRTLKSEIEKMERELGEGDLPSKFASSAPQTEK